MLSLSPAIQAVIVICLICAIGLSLGKIRVRGISLGVTYVFFILDGYHKPRFFFLSFGMASTISVAKQAQPVT